ncbi:hypothetical protein EVAR_88388_1 [Eumeta japonica]|uniref:Uncharacterized protein n=1 Tax=Eumeta variegata TaxID=151549 RepID=A0A4C1XEB2_EUMVA|nr:hypothetical protein EVAR_88388_1 [Eumeta japonica]
MRDPHWLSGNLTRVDSIVKFRLSTPYLSGLENLNPSKLVQCALKGANDRRHRYLINGRAILWSTWLQHENEPARPLRYYTVKNANVVVVALAVVFRPGSKKSGGLLPSIRAYSRDRQRRWQLR